MGFKIACVAVAKADAEKTRVALGLGETGRSDAYCETPFCGSFAKNDTYVIWKNTHDGDFSDLERSRLAENVDFWSFGVHEGVMTGHVDRFENSELVWRICYIGCEDPAVFLTEGNVPQVVLNHYQTLKSKADKTLFESKDAEFIVDDQFEILSETFARFCGLKYDDLTEDSPFQFLELIQNNPPKKKPFWKFF